MYLSLQRLSPLAICDYVLLSGLDISDVQAKCHNNSPWRFNSLISTLHSTLATVRWHHQLTLSIEMFILLRVQGMSDFEKKRNE